jgi:hypothetical protein
MTRIVTTIFRLHIKVFICFVSSVSERFSHINALTGSNVTVTASKTDDDPVDLNKKRT